MRLNQLLDMFGNRITGVAAPSGPTDALASIFGGRWQESDQTTSGAVTIDLNNGNAHQITMNGNVTGLTAQHAGKGDLLVLRIKQDGTGSRTWAWGGFPVIWAHGLTAPFIMPTANSTCTVTFEYDGTNWVEQSRTPIDLSYFSARYELHSHPGAFSSDNWAGYDTIVYDPSGSLSFSAYGAKVAGWYRVHTQFRLTNPNANGVCCASLYINHNSGAPQVFGKDHYIGSGFGTPGCEITSTVHLNVGDYVGGNIFVNAGLGAYPDTATGGGTSNFMTVELVRPG